VFVSFRSFRTFSLTSSMTCFSKISTPAFESFRISNRSPRKPPFVTSVQQYMDFMKSLELMMRFMAFRNLILSVCMILSGCPLYIAVVAMVPPPAPSVMRISASLLIFFLARIFSAIPTPAMPPVILVPMTISPPILSVEPAVMGTLVSSDMHDTPAMKSNSLLISASSPRCISTMMEMGFAPLTSRSLRHALVTWNPAMNGKSLNLECMPSILVTTKIFLPLFSSLLFLVWFVLIITAPASSMHSGGMKAFLTPDAIFVTSS